MNILEATRSYDRWMRTCTTVVESDLRSKHQQMKQYPFLFFRGTFYRWIQLWPEICPQICSAPKVLASGDVHVGSFGTWRDSEGRLCWGIDDFDECYLLPYTNDLVRLAASVKMVIDVGELTIKLKDACEVFSRGMAKLCEQAAARWSWRRVKPRSKNLGLTPWSSLQAIAQPFARRS